MASVAPALPTLKLIKSEEPTPLVDCKESEEPTAVPPTTNGSIIEVVKVGVVPNTKVLPDPVVVLPKAVTVPDCPAVRE